MIIIIMIIVMMIIIIRMMMTITETPNPGAPPSLHGPEAWLQAESVGSHLPNQRLLRVWGRRGGISGCLRCRLVWGFTGFWGVSGF